MESRRYFDLIAQGSSGASLESRTKGDNIERAVRGELLERLRAEIEFVAAKTGLAIDGQAVETLMDQAGRGIDRLLGEGSDAFLAPAEISGLEAVVRSDGSRPVLFVEDDFVDVTAPSAAGFAVDLSKLEEQVRSVCRAVGRVDDPSYRARRLGYQGTAWMVGEGLVVTNFHVLEAVALGYRVGTTFEGRLNTGVAVDFGHEVGDSPTDRRFPIRRVIHVGAEGRPEFADPTLGGMNFDGLDMAVLELEPVPGREFPTPPRRARSTDPERGEPSARNSHPVYALGYPGDERSTTPDLFARLFDAARGFKRLAPGLITAAAGTLAEDPRGRICAHDASTLGGNSGSAVVDMRDGSTVAALHFAGIHLGKNWAYSLPRIEAELDSVVSGVSR